MIGQKDQFKKQKISFILYLKRLMSRNRNKQQKKVIDATVIDQAILTKAVKDYLNQNKIIPKDNLDFGKIKVLSLSFLNIWKIQYLESFARLEKLQLDNNIIEKIQNIGHLTNLKWLDLSFNNIKQIEGLQKLINLTDLSLYNNKIMVLDGLHNCTKLNIFSVGNNLIKSFQEIIAYFGRGTDKKTRFKYLQVLNVYGNPFTIKDGEKDSEYEFHLVAHLPNLRYLDYVFIDEKRRIQIRQSDDKFKTEDQATFLKELKIEQDKEKEQDEQKRKKQHAKMHLLDGFSQEIVNIDDLKKIQKMTGLEEQIQKFTSKVKELIEAMQKKIKEENQFKLSQLKKLQSKLSERQRQAEKKSLQAILQFEQQKKNYDKIFQNRFVNKNWREEASKLKEKIYGLKDNLLNIEVELMEDADLLYKKEIHGVLEEFNKRIQSILSEEPKEEKNDEVGYFKKIQDQIKEFGTQLQKIAKEEVERYINMQSSGEGEQQFSSDPELNSILQNRQTIPGTISSIKEMLGEKKSRKEAEIDGQLCNKDKEAYKKSYDEKQYDRNRKNIKNINQKIQKLVAEVNIIMALEDEDD